MLNFIGKFSAYSKDIKEHPFGKPKNQKSSQSGFGDFSSITGSLLPAPIVSSVSKHKINNKEKLDYQKPIKIIPEHIFNHEISGLPGEWGFNYFWSSSTFEILYLGGGSIILMLTSAGTSTSTSTLPFLPFL